MITCLVIDDEAHARERIINAINKRPGWEVIGEAAAYEDAKSVFLDFMPDVCFVDVNLIGGNGISLIKELKHKSTCKWVVMSGLSDYAIDSYDIEAENYLLKPIETMRLEKTLLKIELYHADKMYHQMSDNNNKLMLKW